MTRLDRHTQPSYQCFFPSHADVGRRNRPGVEVGGNILRTYILHETQQPHPHEFSAFQNYIFDNNPASTDVLRTS